MDNVTVISVIATLAGCIVTLGGAVAFLLRYLFTHYLPKQQEVAVKQQEAWAAQCTAERALFGAESASNREQTAEAIEVNRNLAEAVRDMASSVGRLACTNPEPNGRHGPRIYPRVAGPQED